MRKVLWAVLGVAALLAWLIINQPDDPHTYQTPPLTPIDQPWYGNRQ